MQIGQIKIHGCHFVALLIVGILFTSTATAFESEIDQFVVIRNGDVYFNDTFSDNKPPSYFKMDERTEFNWFRVPAYFSSGIFSESDGRALMDSDFGNCTAGLAGSLLDEPILFTNATLNTNTNPDDPDNGLKSGDTFEVRALFDIVLPEKKNDGYYIRFSDRTSTFPGDDIVILGVRRSPTTGVDGVGFAKANFVTGAGGLADHVPLEPGHDQILLRLERRSMDNNIVASFAYVDGGTINISDDNAIADLAFIELDNELDKVTGDLPGNPGDPITIFNGENYTRVQFNSLVPRDCSSARLVSMSPASISQFVDTPMEDFALKFVYRFETNTGELTVELAGQELISVPEPHVVSPNFTQVTVDVPASLQGLTGALLEFRIDGDAGSSVLLDNIDFPGVANGNFAEGSLESWMTAGNVTGVVLESPEDATIEIAKAIVAMKHDRTNLSIYGRFIVNPETGDGIDPRNEDVRVVIDGLSQTIPAGSFHRFPWHHVYSFFGGKDSAINQMLVTKGGWFWIWARDVDLGSTNLDEPVDFSIHIGNDLGQTEAEFDRVIRRPVSFFHHFYPFDHVSGP